MRTDLDVLLVVRLLGQYVEGLLRSGWHHLLVQLSDWVGTQIDIAEAMVDSSIIGWDAIEMAVQEHGEGGAPRFSHPTAPCIQLTKLAIVFADEKSLLVSHYQGDDGFGFRLDRRVSPFQIHGTDGIYRRTQLAELPTGPVKAVITRTATGTGDLAELVIDVDDQELLLIAGEISETWTERLEWRWLDESTLIFSNPDDANALDWVPQRNYDERCHR